MALIKYTSSAFNKDEASSGKLCICVRGSHTVGTDIMSDSGDFKGAGMPTYKDYKFSLTINGKLYVFNDSGEPSNNAAWNAFDSGEVKSCKLVMGTINKNIVQRGNVVTTFIEANDETAPTRSEETGYTPAEETYIEGDTGQNVYVDSLNARDHFASQVLQTILARMEKNPATVSDDEMLQLSDTAYKWAASMMVAAANARATLKDDTAGDTSSEAEIGELDSNTEKLLNNIIIALQRSDYATDTDPIQYFKRFILGNAGIGGANTRPIYISSKGYNSITEAEADGWSYSTADQWWEKDGFESIKVAYTDIGARTLPTNKISIAEMSALIAAIDRLTDAIQNN